MSFKLTPRQRERILEELEKQRRRKAKRAGRRPLRKDGQTVNTGYRFIYFERAYTSPNHAPRWLCKNRRKQFVLGQLTYQPEWNEYVFKSQPNCIFSAGCLLDIADFTRQLNARMKGVPNGSE